MLADQELDRKVKLLMFDLMLVLYNYGLKEVNVGGMMRLLGVDAVVAAEHDAESVKLTQEFAKYVQETRETRRPDSETLH